MDPKTWAPSPKAGLVISAAACRTCPHQRLMWQIDCIRPSWQEQPTILTGLDPRCDFHIPTIPTIGPPPAPLAKTSQSISICRQRILNNIVSDLRTCLMAKRLLGHGTHGPCHTPHLPEAASLREQWDRGTANRASQGMGQSLVSLGCAAISDRAPAGHVHLKPTVIIWCCVPSR